MDSIIRISRIINPSLKSPLWYENSLKESKIGKYFIQGFALFYDILKQKTGFYWGKLKFYSKKRKPYFNVLSHDVISRVFGSEVWL